MTESRPFRNYLILLAIGLPVLAAAGIWYSGRLGVQLRATGPIIAAFLVEFALYVLPGFPALRNRLAGRFPVLVWAALLAASAVVPYLIYSLGTGLFRPEVFVRLLVVVLALSFWYVFRRPVPSSDLAFVAIAASILLFRFFKRVYIAPHPAIPDISILGHLMLIRLSAMVMLTIREVDRVEFIFVPAPRDWKVGAKWFAWFLPIGIPMLVGLEIARFDPSPDRIMLAPLQFAGILWVLALSEEFFFRGLLQQWFGDWTGKERFAWIAASVLFGLCHLGFREFPNYKFAALAAVAGLFYGKAWRETGSIGSSMVTHALVVTLWRSLFR